MQGLVFAVITIWLALTATISGFSVDSPSEIIDLFRRPAIFVEGAIAAIAGFVYTAAVETVLSPVVEVTIRRIVRPAVVARGSGPEPR